MHSSTCHESSGRDVENLIWRQFHNSQSFNPIPRCTFLQTSIQKRSVPNLSRGKRFYFPIRPTSRKPLGFVERFLNYLIPFFPEAYTEFRALTPQLSIPKSEASFAREQKVNFFSWPKNKQQQTIGEEKEKIGRERCYGLVWLRFWSWIIKGASPG